VSFLLGLLVFLFFLLLGFYRRLLLLIYERGLVDAGVDNYEGWLVLGRFCA
jgi:uncharacterized membrane protein